jgi:nucleoid DNA-binding protein
MGKSNIFLKLESALSISSKSLTEEIHTLTAALEKGGKCQMKNHGDFAIHHAGAHPPKDVDQPTPFRGCLI